MAPIRQRPRPAASKSMRFPPTRAGASILRPSAPSSAADVAGIMITNPNTCGLFEGDIARIAEDMHKAGGYVYGDGANFNAIVGRVRPGDLGIDCMHINLHKTFSTPHGGGGPGSGPVVLSEALAPFAPLPYVVHGKEGFALVEHDADAPKGAELRPPQGLPRPDGHVHPRARLHDEPRLRRLAPGRERCGAERQLPDGLPRRAS